MMTKLWSRVLFLFLLSISLINCGDDAVELPTEQNNLIGTWQVESIEVDGTISGLSVSEQPAPTGTITFKKDFTGQESYSYTIKGQTFRESNSFTWVSTNNTITFDAGTEDEQQWSRLINEENKQSGTFQQETDDYDLNFSISLTK